ncbi:MAG: UbiX family flavin prenyltransferase [Clostridiales bacterium]|nr:UbiX family flavin prenyltransferase [Clostridiales bacterium]
MKIVIGISGASGSVLGVSLLKALQGFAEAETHLVVSRLGWQTLVYETGLAEDDVKSLAQHNYAADNMFAPIASGSFAADGMIICPCSMKTVAGICSGFSDNLLLRAADCCLKENKPLVLVPREMPLSKLHLRNLSAAAELGCAIIPPVLTFYNHPRQVEDHIDHIIGKILAQFGLCYSNFRPWEGE